MLTSDDKTKQELNQKIYYYNILAYHFQLTLRHSALYCRPLNEKERNMNNLKSMELKFKKKYSLFEQSV